MANIIDTIKNWPTKNKIIFFSTIIISIAALVILFSWLQTADYQVLFSNLADDDIGLIIQKLKEMKVPYKIEYSNVLVPAHSVYDLRLQLAAKGIPQGSGIGFELFDKTNFGATNFVQKINYRRAMQGELARTITSIIEVEQCRVHLSIPEKSIFISEEEKPSASVLVKLKSGRYLAKGQVQGIVHLISSSVEGLDSKDVTIIDDHGEMLTHKADDVIGLSINQLEYQHNYESAMESRIIDILEPVVGKGKVKAKVTAAIDFTRRESTEEKFDPDGQVVRSEQKDVEKEVSTGNGGVPGVTSNLPGKAKQVSSSNLVSQKQNETVNYEISKVTKHVMSSFGGIKRLTAAVLVDGTYVEQKDSKEMKYSPRSEEDIKLYDELVKKATGFMSERGDEVKVVNMAFEVIHREELPEPEKEYLPDVITIAKYLVPLLVALFFFLFVLKPMIQVLSISQVGEKVPELPLPQTVNEIEKGMHSKEIPSEKDSTETVIEWAKNNPQQATGLIKGWIEEQ